MRIRELVAGHATLERIATAVLSARSTLKAEYGRLHKAVLALVRDDAVCRRLMTVPGVGPLVAITYKSAIDDPHRIVKTKAAGALFGVTPKNTNREKKTSQAGSRWPEMRRCGGCCMKPLTLYYRASRGSQTQALRDGRRQGKRREARKGCPGRQARSDPASDLGRVHWFASTAVNADPRWCGAVCRPHSRASARRA